MVVVPVTDVLHLKSAVLPVAPDTVVVTPGVVDETLLAGVRIVYEAEAERGQFTALLLESGEVLVSASAPETSEVVSGLGIEVVPIDVSEILAADGGLTCMSVLL
jgi:dimethylargininase